MDQPTQANQPNGMRELLRRWAELEPLKCEKSVGDTYIIEAADVRHYCESDDLGERNLAWIQWAVQQAIIARGWRYNLECYPVTGICEGVVFFNSTHTRRAGTNPPEALLDTYLKVLESNQ